MQAEEHYEKVCKAQFDNILKAIEKTNANINGMKDRLFEDNGNKCMQSKINQNSLWLRIFIGVFSTIGAAIIGVIAWIVRGIFN